MTWGALISLLLIPLVASFFILRVDRAKVRTNEMFLSCLSQPNVAVLLSEAPVALQEAVQKDRSRINEAGYHDHINTECRQGLCPGECQ